MSNDIDKRLETLARQPHPSLHGLEGKVWARIDAVRGRRATARVLMPLRAASLVGALGLGLVGGRLAATAAERPAPEISVFSIDANLAPSTLLGGH